MLDPHEDHLIRMLECIHLAWWLAERLDAVIRMVLSLV
jgi:hypothetical protein